MNHSLGRRYILLFILIVVSICVAIFANSFSRRDKIIVKVDLAPKIATLTVDGKVMKGGDVYLSPGYHTFTAKLGGFEELSEKINITGPRSVRLLLTANTEDGRKIANKYQADYSKIEAQAGEEASKEGKQILDKNPIINNIPRVTSYYRIDYKKDANNNIVIKISSPNPMGRQVAVDQVRSWGFDPTNYTIEFTDLTNPFTQPSGGPR